VTGLFNVWVVLDFVDGMEMFLRQVFLSSLGCLVLHLRNEKSPLVLDCITIWCCGDMSGKKLWATFVILSPCLSNAWFVCFQYVVDDRSFVLSVSVLPKYQLHDIFFNIPE